MSVTVKKVHGQSCVLSWEFFFEESKPIVKPYAKPVVGTTGNMAEPDYDVNKMGE